jgi:hypothetical protein
MKPIRIFGLAALAALMAMAFVGASSALAESTSLCDTDPGTGATEACPSGHLVTSVHETSVGKAKLLTSFGPVECNALFSGTIATTLAKPLVISGNFTYSNCTLGGSSCTATEENGPAEIKVLKEGHETASVTGEGLVHVICGKAIDCSYTGAGLKATAKGPLLASQENGEVSLSEQVTSKEAGGFLCPKSAKLDITMTPLSATYITGAESTSLCDTDPGTGATEACPSGHLVTSVHETSVGKAKLLTSFGPVECNALFSGTIATTLAKPLVISGNFTYSNCTLGGSSCTATEENGPAEIKVLKEGHETASVTGEGLVHVICGKAIDCSYTGAGLKATAKGPLLASQENGEVSLSEQVTSKEAGGFLCPKSAKLDITMTPLSATYITE